MTSINGRRKCGLRYLEQSQMSQNLAVIMRAIANAKFYKAKPVTYARKIVFLLTKGNVLPQVPPLIFYDLGSTWNPILWQFKQMVLCSPRWLSTRNYSLHRLNDPPDISNSTLQKLESRKFFFLIPLIFIFINRYEAGDHLGIYAENDPEIVQEFAKRLNVNLDEEFAIQSVDKPEDTSKDRLSTLTINFTLICRFAILRFPNALHIQNCFLTISEPLFTSKQISFACIR